MNRKNYVAVGIVGANGKMGVSNLNAVMGDSDLFLSGALVRGGSSWIGKDVAELLGGNKVGVEFSSNVFEVLRISDVCVDFSSPERCFEVLKANLTLGHKKPFVIGSTGFCEKDIVRIRQYALNFPIVMDQNFSLGLQILSKALEYVALRFDESYDANIVEEHHRLKQDSPSGTALKLRSCTGREAEDCPIVSLRSGGNPGTHLTRFTSQGEQVVFLHQAFSRDVFSEGAMRSAKWVVKQEKGFFSMKDVLKF